MPATVRYKPANTMADLSSEARAAGRESMAEFLLSPQLQAPVSAATADIADAAKVLARADAYQTGAYMDSITPAVGAPIIVAGNARVSGVVTAHGGTPPAATNPETSVAAIVEFGNVKAGGQRILGRAGEPFHTEKKPL